MPLARGMCSVSLPGSPRSSHDPAGRTTQPSKPTSSGKSAQPSYEPEASLSMRAEGNEDEWGERRRVPQS